MFLISKKANLELLSHRGYKPLHSILIYSAKFDMILHQKAKEKQYNLFNKKFFARIELRQKYKIFFFRSGAPL